MMSKIDRAAGNLLRKDKKGNVCVMLPLLQNLQAFIGHDNHLPSERP